MQKHWHWNGSDFEWMLPTSNRVKIGDIVGTLRDDGYIQVQFYGLLYKLHNLVWLWHTGKWPKGEIDHRDRNPGNNCYDNLRETSSTGQKLNARGHCDAEFPKGVAYDPKYAVKPYRVQISRHYKVVHCSHHATLEEAVAQANTVYTELERIEFG